MENPISIPAAPAPRKKTWMLVPALIAIGLGVYLTVFAGGSGTAKNPDPNHTHADFAVWIGGTRLDFSDAKFMSGSASDETHEKALHKYFHLHDGNGNVIHRHKPGLMLGEFFDSLGFGYSATCWYEKQSVPGGQECKSGALKMFVNGKEIPTTPDFLFADGDQILLTDATDPSAITEELQQLTDEACLYSRTCPGRGKPPTENCIADPAVPCVEE